MSLLIFLPTLIMSKIQESIVVSSHCFNRFYKEEVGLRGDVAATDL